jgi:hypothetical protein
MDTYILQQVSADGLSGECVAVQGRFPCNAAFNAATGLCKTEGLTVSYYHHVIFVVLA